RQDDQAVEQSGDDGGDVDVGALLAVDELDAETRAGGRRHRVDQRLDDDLREGRHDRGERGADDHGDGEVDDVATQDEVLEALEHTASSTAGPAGGRDRRSRSPALVSAG